MLFFSCAILFLYFAQRLNCSEPAYLLFIGLSVLTLGVLPAFQFNVGTDYFTYYGLTKDIVQTEIILKKNELLFYYFVRFLSHYGLHGQWIFIIHSTLSSILLANILRKLMHQGYTPWVLLFLVIVVTGLVHNQMNGLRSILAVYIFINAFIYKATGQLAKAVFFSVAGVLCHQSFIVMFLFVAMPLSFYLIVFEHLRLVYIITFFLFGSGLFVKFLEAFVMTAMPFYSHYLRLPFFNSGVDIINVLTKLYYFPLHVIFLVFLYRGIGGCSRFDRVILGFWVLGANLYLGLFYVSGLFRAYHYVVFFSVIPIYFLIVRSRFGHFASVSIVCYLLLPYLLKVLLSSEGEYSYRFFFLS